MTDIRFFCENCGKRVKASDKICPFCGSFFSRVRCPSCNYEGDAKAFARGCPSCGYSVENAKDTIDGPIDEKRFKVLYTIKESKPREKIPVWLFPLAGFLLLAAVFVAVVVGGRK